MPVLGITGGVATGKSTFTSLFAGMLDAQVFDADRCVHELLATDVEVIEQVIAAFGATVRAPGRGVSRAALRERVFGQPDRRKVLEGILHPRVRRAWMDAGAKARAGDGTMVLDIPLLFETGAESELDRTIVVAASEVTQMHRITRHRAVPAETARQMIAAQMPMGEKISRASHVVWNEGALAALREQAALVAALAIAA